MTLLEENMNLRQHIDTLKQRHELMVKPRTEEGINALALRVALLIEDEYAKGHQGGRSQRLAKMQVIAREAIREALTGERKWDAWTPNSSRFAPQPE